MQREYPDHPIVGVGAVIVQDGRVVLARRARAPLLGRWSIPGGAVELGETLRAAAEREALEETGLIVKAGEVLEVLDRIIPGGDGRTQYHYVLVDFICERVGGELCAGADASDAAWANENELGKYELEELAVAVIRKAFSAGKHPANHHSNVKERQKSKSSKTKTTVRQNNPRPRIRRA